MEIVICPAISLIGASTGKRPSAWMISQPMAVISPAWTIETGAPVWGSDRTTSPW